jgi:hypothetical protein
MPSLASPLVTATGIVRPEAAEDPDLGWRYARYCPSSAGQGSMGKGGPFARALDAFALEPNVILAWLDQAVGSGIEAAAYDAVEAVRAKVDDYFARCGSLLSTLARRTP